MHHNRFDEAESLKKRTRGQHRVDIYSPYIKAEARTRRSAAWGGRSVLRRLMQKKAPREICISLVGDSRIRRLNRSYLGRDRVTDVLSFPLGTRVDGYWHLGDVIICLPQARRQARQQAHGLAREVATLAVHGTLHLLGYDHGAPRDAMSKIESDILKGFRNP